MPNFHEGESARFFVHEWDLISQVLQKGNVWEPHLHEVFEARHDKNGLFLDIGANIGSHSVKAALLWEKVVAFEPHPRNYSLLRDNLRLNRLSNTLALPYAASDRTYSTNFSHVIEGNLGAAALYQEESLVDGSVDCITVDSLTLPRCDFIKLDVEGYELRVLKGARETIKKFKPDIVLECWSS